MNVAITYNGKSVVRGAFKKLQKMTETTIDKKNKKILIETKFDFQGFTIEKFGRYFQVDFKISKFESIGFALFFNDFGGKKYYPTKIIQTNIKGRNVEIYYSTEIVE